MVSVRALLLLIWLLFAIAKAQLPQPGVYHNVTSHTCIHTITSSSECLAAAKGLYPTLSGITNETETNYPYGCYVYTGNAVPAAWFNNDPTMDQSGSRSTECDKDHRCICKGSPTAAFPGVTFSKVTTGNHVNCEAAGKHTPASISMCILAANSANFSKTFTVGDVNINTDIKTAPALTKGCYVTSSLKLQLNTYTGVDANGPKCGTNGIACLCVNAMVHGGWSAVKNSSCDYPCDDYGYGTQYAMRACDNPAPSGGGVSCTGSTGITYAAGQTVGPPNSLSSKCPTKGLPVVMQTSLYKASASTFMHLADPQRQKCPVPASNALIMNPVEHRAWGDWLHISVHLCQYPAWTIEECKQLTGQTPTVEGMYQCDHNGVCGTTAPAAAKYIVARPPGCYRKKDDGKVYFTKGLMYNWKESHTGTQRTQQNLEASMAKPYGEFKYYYSTVNSQDFNTKLRYISNSFPVISPSSCSEQYPCYCHKSLPVRKLWGDWVKDSCTACPFTGGAGITKYNRTCLVSNNEMCIGATTKTNGTVCNECPKWEMNSISSCESNGVYGEREYKRSCAPSQCVGGTHKHVREQITECKLVKTNVQCGGTASTHTTVTHKSNCGSACGAHAITTSVATQSSPECRWERNVTKNPCAQCHRHQGKLRGSIFEYRRCQGESGVTVTCNGGNMRRFSTSCTTCGAISKDYPQSATCSTCLHSGTGFEPHDTNRTSEVRCMNCAQPCPLNVFESFTKKPYYDLANPVYNTATCGDFENKVHGVETAKGLIDLGTHAGIQDDEGGDTVSNGDFSHLSADTYCKASCQGGSNVMVTGHIKCVNTTLLHNTSGTFTPFNVTNKATWPRCDIPASKMTASQMESIYVAKFGSSKCA